MRLRCRRPAAARSTRCSSRTKLSGTSVRRAGELKLYFLTPVFPANGVGFAPASRGQFRGQPLASVAPATLPLEFYATTPIAQLAGDNRARRLRTKRESANF